MKVTIRPPDNRPDPETRMKDMKIGDLAVMPEGSSYEGHVIMAIFPAHSDDPAKFVALSDPGLTWGRGCESKVNLLPEGTRVILEVE